MSFKLKKLKSRGFRSFSKLLKSSAKLDAAYRGGDC